MKEKKTTTISPLANIKERTPAGITTPKKLDDSLSAKRMDDCRPSKKINEELFVIDKMGDFSKHAKRNQLLKIEELCIPKSSVSALIPVKRAFKIKKEKKAKVLNKTKPIAREEFKDLWEDTLLPSSKKEEAIKIPHEAFHSGSSYNPSKEQHQKALALAILREVNRQSFKEVFIQNKQEFVSFEETSKPLIEINDTVLSEDNPVQLSQGKVELNADDQFIPNLSKKTDRVTNSKKTARKRERECQLLSEKKMQTKKIHSQIDSIRKITSEILSKSVIKKPTHNEKGIKKYQQPMFPVLMDSELPTSLRTISCSPVESFIDQFKRYQQKQFVEVRLPSKLRKRKYALKEYQKRSYKNFELSYNKLN